MDENKPGPNEFRLCRVIAANPDQAGTAKCFNGIRHAFISAEKMSLVLYSNRTGWTLTDAGKKLVADFEPVPRAPVYVRIQQSGLQHDHECKDVVRHYRVTRPLGYSPNTPGYLDVSARQGHYTVACCATKAAHVARERLVGKGYGKLSELDVQVWP